MSSCYPYVPLLISDVCITSPSIVTQDCDCELNALYFFNSYRIEYLEK